MQVLLVEPYDTGSHAAWMRGYQAHSRHTVTILSLPGQFWQWRMHGGAVTLARMFLEADYQPDVIVTSDMLDLTTFLALTRHRTSSTPAAVYFHENQFTYPLGPRQRKELHYHLGFINYISAMAADAVFFNSQYHHDAFFDELPRLLKHYPDHTELPSIDGLRIKSGVLSLGLDLARFDPYRAVRPPGALPLIIWNHRWEHDKNPRPFLNALVRLADEGVAFEVALTGENFRQDPQEFEAARERLGQRVIQYGYVERFADYAALLWQADVQVSTAQHDFFGVSTCEAIYCGCYPLLPNRLNYPDLVPAPSHADHLYLEGEIYYRLRDTLAQPAPPTAELRSHVQQFDWSVLAPVYDATLERLTVGGQ
jgi:glycosyltransferase involved in cell wall biosynthesis